jgi:hypothetical protein
VRLTRRLIVSLFAISLVTAGTASVAGAHGDEDDGTMSPQEMKCMSKSYAKEHPKLCPSGQTSHAKGGHTHGGKVTLAHPLRYTPDGLIDATRINLTGVKGVTKKQAKVAKRLLVSTIKTLPRWSDPATAVAEGFQSIGDGLTGEEHFLHWDWINDDEIFNPARPESLVYKVDRRTGAKQLEAAMYILPDKYTLDNPPKKYASNLVQFHQHDNLCFSAPPASQVRGLTDAQGNCRPPLVKFNPNIQVHVWIRANDCGPFASLLGVGAGQIKSGTERSCVHDPDRVGL